MTIEEAKDLVYQAVLFAQNNGEFNNCEQIEENDYLNPYFILLEELENGMKERRKNADILVQKRMVRENPLRRKDCRVPRSEQLLDIKIVAQPLLAKPRPFCMELYKGLVGRTSPVHPESWIYQTENDGGHHQG